MESLLAAVENFGPTLWWTSQEPLTKFCVLAMESLHAAVENFGPALWWTLREPLAKFCVLAEMSTLTVKNSTNVLHILYDVMVVPQSDKLLKKKTLTLPSGGHRRNH